MKKFYLIALMLLISSVCYGDTWNFVILDNAICGLGWNNVGTQCTQTMQGINIETGEIETYTVISNPHVITDDDGIIHPNWKSYYRKQGKEYGEFIENLGNNKLSDIIR